MHICAYIYRINPKHFSAQLLWTMRHAGMYSDDLPKSPHMARIAGEPYLYMCVPVCVFVVCVW